MENRWEGRARSLARRAGRSGVQDERGHVSWLKTVEHGNVRFYTGLGLEVVDESPMLTSHQWLMRRRPR